MGSCPFQKLIEKSRFRTEEYINQIVRYSIPEAITLEEIQKLSDEDPELIRIKQVILEGNWDQKGIPDAYKRVRDELTIANGVLLRQSRIVIPKELRNRCLELVFITKIKEVCYL